MNSLKFRGQNFSNSKYICFTNVSLTNSKSCKMRFVFELRGSPFQHSKLNMYTKKLAYE